MNGTQADRIEQKLNALCKAVGGAGLAKLDLSEPGRVPSLAEQKLARVRKYAEKAEPVPGPG